MVVLCCLSSPLMKGKNERLGDERDDHRGVQLPDVLPVLLRHQARRPRRTRGSRRARAATARRRASTSASSTTPTRSTRASYGDTKLDGAKFWVAGDLGGEFSKGEMDWAVLHVRPVGDAGAARGHQGDRSAHVYPVKWKSVHGRRRQADRVDGDEGQGRARSSTAARSPRSC